MKTIAELCVPRKGVLDGTAKDDVLNLTDLTSGRIDADKFFSENFKTKGMELLLDTAFRRFQGKSETGVIKLTQSMGGGKTHNMIALATLATNAKWRHEVCKGAYDDIGDVKVIAFSGRESDERFGIWGSLAEQLGKKELFSDLYSPLRAPGESSWTNLLKGQKVLILLDELPPYLENAKSISVGNSDLCKVTITALSNLFNALGKEELSNVCLVFSDLKAAYESASDLLQSSFKDLESEANRVAIDIEPVALNSDEVYDILRTKLFEKVPNKGATDINEIAVAYKEAVASANKSGLTNYTPEAVYLGIKDSYPFHPSIKDLYARFKENHNFQQTRGLIRLMRQIIKKFYENGRADETSLVNVFDIDMNDQTMISFMKEIRSALDTAMNHDIAQHGKAVAEIFDNENKAVTKYPYAQMTAKLLFMSSLDENPTHIHGLSDQESMGYLCEPGLDMSQFSKALDALISGCWYMTTDSRGMRYFQENENTTAKMNSLIDSYSNEAAKKELRKFLEQNFKPTIGSCYKKLFVMPAVDEIKLERDDISLVIYEPYGGLHIHPDLEDFYNNQPFKNRVMFLSGQKGIMDRLYENSKKLTAIRQIIQEMKDKHVPEGDQQYREAQNTESRALTQLLSTIRETFINLYFPKKDGLESEDFRLEFANNKFNGEEQIIRTLSDAKKFEDFQKDAIFMDNLKKKCEKRIFTQQQMPWSTILDRAASETSWQWYHPSQMDELKKYCLKADVWREEGGYIDKGPFAKEETDVRIEQLDYNPKTKEFSLKVSPVHGNVVLYEVGAEPSNSSSEVKNPFITKETELYFVCKDTSATDPHPTGPVKHFWCEVPLKHEQRTSTHGQVMQLETHPGFEIKYTTDGSNPKESGGKYNGEFVIPDGSKYIRIAVYNKGHLVEEKDIPVVAAGSAKKKIEIDDNATLTYKFGKSIKFTETSKTYEEFARLQKLKGTRIGQFDVTILQQDNSNKYLELNSQAINYEADQLQATVDLIRETAFEGKNVTVEMSYKVLHFSTGALFKEWVDMNKYDLDDLVKNGEIKQND